MKKRLIDANALSSIAFQIKQYGKGIRCVVDLNDIDDIPTLDAVEVVRCKDCAVPHNKWTGCPKLNGLIPPPEHFCSYGERRNNG